jgi:hypothetical protein
MKFAVDEATAIVEGACEAISLLEKENLSEGERNEAANRLLAALPYLDHLKYVYPHTNFPDKLYRVRAAKGIGGDESTDEVKTFSYPSPEKCRTARANKEGCPVFYVSDNPGTALKEAGCRKGEVVYLSEWQVKSAENASLFLFFDHPLPARHSWEDIRARQSAQFNQLLANAPASVKQKWLQLHKVYCKAFLGDDYQISSLVGHELLHAQKKPDIQLLVYPSIVEGDQYSNMAIHPEFADAHVQMTRAWKLKVSDENFKQQPELLEAGEVSGEKISWHKASNEIKDKLPL